MAHGQNLPKYQGFLSKKSDNFCLFTGRNIKNKTGPLKKYLCFEVPYSRRLVIHFHINGDIILCFYCEIHFGLTVRWYHVEQSGNNLEL